MVDAMLNGLTGFIRPNPLFPTIDIENKVCTRICTPRYMCVHIYY